MYPPRLSATDLQVAFPLGLAESRTFRASVGNMLRGNPTKDQFKLGLYDVNFTLRTGDRLGIVGANGAGKSTLIQTLIGTYEPTKGRVIRIGRVAGLISAKTGMVVDDTGMSNIYRRGRQAGLSREAIEGYLPKILDFAALGDDIDRAVRTYSTGMSARLGFAIATCMSAQIYIMDEWIGAGDARFVDKAQQRIEAMFDEEHILVLATHVDALIKRWCNQVLVLHEGRQIALTDVATGLDIKNRILKDEAVNTVLASHNLPPIPDSDALNKTRIVKL
ncbi:ABC transporter ATP-binding protein [Algimonas ampicilliniresistens]|jgi:ABC-type polysaccharide/polyol phosphate transport system ATPase subunit|uniref:ABC transporter ATP-binding protein n=1 Tax=Algimonas ampicilliniresistens TaxID=1298735 RepID=A0ABQ5VE75_9PROT|nr:ATP-binding cassette domain-containing protein [Algimonas ampicilliniresistens]GLQ24712.1 ABC transporter ATP-binding protein [Algimonas ampicilliniresistens]